VATNSNPSLPGLTRQSILLRKKMDARVKPAHDSLAIEGRSRCFQADAKPVKLAASNAQSKGHTP
jgi:hypothetical protein